MSHFHEQSAVKLARNLAPDLAQLQVDGKRIFEGREDPRAALLVVVIQRAEAEREGR